MTPIRVWRDYGTEGWHFEDHPSLLEAVTRGRLDSSCVVTIVIDVGRYLNEPAAPEATPETPVDGSLKRRDSDSETGGTVRR